MIYSVTGTLEPHSAEDLTLEQNAPFVVKQMDPAFEPQIQTGIAKLKGGCFASKGQGKISTKMDKGIYHSDEIPRLLADIDNSGAMTDCKALFLELVQEVKLKVEDADYSMTTTLGQHKVSGLLKGEQTGGLNKFCDLDLGEIKVKQAKSMKEFTENEQNYAQKVQPTITGQFVTVDYHIRLTAKYGGGETKTVNPVFLHCPKTKPKPFEAPKKWSPKANPPVTAKLEMAAPAETESPTKRTESMRRV